MVSQETKPITCTFGLQGNHDSPLIVQHRRAIASDQLVLYNIASILLIAV